MGYNHYIPYSGILSYQTKLFTVILLQVYDMTQYLSGHPGGLAMLKQAGKDATSNFKLVSAHCTVTKYIEDVLDRRFVGELNKEH